MIYLDNAATTKPSITAFELAQNYVTEKYFNPSAMYKEGFAVQGELKKYDVALYKDSHSRYVLHRVIAVRDGYYVMRGDNNFFRETVKKDAVIGVLVAYRNKNRRHSVNELHYKIYSRFWHYIYPFRAFFRKTRMALSRVKAKMKK